MNQDQFYRSTPWLKTQKHIKAKHYYLTPKSVNGKTPKANSDYVYDICRRSPRWKYGFRLNEAVAVRSVCASNPRI